MKQRMYNTFFRKTKNKYMANFLTVFSYGLLRIYYFFARIILKNKKNNTVIDEKTASDAKDVLNKIHPVKDMHCEFINLPTNEQVDLSIIVPAYNVEKYIKECIDSILNQNTTYNYELIIVNDGSTDATEDKIKEIHSSKIRYIKQENQGLSGARNTGINHAVGKCITFIDSDDVITDGSIDLMMDQMIQYDADIVLGGYYSFEDYSHAKQFFLQDYAVIENNPEEMIFNPGFAWGKIFQRKMFEKIRFPMGAWFEDTIMCSVLFRMCKKMVIVPNAVYGYRQNQAGISKNSRKSPRALEHLWVMQDAIEQAHKNNISDDKYLYGLCINHFSNIMYRRISLLQDDVIKCAFVIACDILRKIEISDYISQGNLVEKDIIEAFHTGNYKLWKAASFVV